MAIGSEHERMVDVHGVSDGQQPELLCQVDLDRRRGKQVHAAHDMGRPEAGVLDDGDQVIGGQAVTSPHHDVAEVTGDVDRGPGHRDPRSRWHGKAECSVRHVDPMRVPAPAGAAAARRALQSRAGAGTCVDEALVGQRIQGGSVAMSAMLLGPVTLEFLRRAGSDGPLDAQAPEHAEDVIDVFPPVAMGVGVVDTEGDDGTYLVGEPGDRLDIGDVSRVEEAARGGCNARDEARQEVVLTA